MSTMLMVHDDDYNDNDLGAMHV